MNKIVWLIVLLVTSYAGFGQSALTESLLKAKKDSSLRAAIHADSLKIEAEFAEKERWDKIKSRIEYPVLNGGEFSGIIPVKDVTEIPDPKMDYKLLFELTSANPDSMAKEINYGLVELSRVINLHVASGIPIKKIMPVIVIHAGALNVVTNNAYYKEHYKTENPNLKLIEALRQIGARFIACGQAMSFFNIKKEEMIPGINLSLTAQTVLSSYQLKGYVWYDMNFDKK